MNKHLSALPLVLSALVAQAPAHAWTPEEVSTGAAAVAILAQKCTPQHYESLRGHALKQLESMLREFPAYERSVIVDSAEMKIKALSISSQDVSCDQANNLRAMAKQWGFGNFFAP